MKIENINTLGELKASGYESISIKDELRNNLDRIKSGKPALRGVHGFENTVIPSGTSHFIPS
jgi:magnesium chelatase subunit I